MNYLQTALNALWQQTWSNPGFHLIKRAKINQLLFNLDNVNFIQYNYAGATGRVPYASDPYAAKQQNPCSDQRAGQSDQLEGSAIGDPVTFAAAVVSTLHALWLLRSAAG